MLLGCLLAILATIVAGVVTFFKWKFQYWKNRNVSYEKPSIPFGALQKVVLQQESYAELFCRFYDKAKRDGLQHFGLYMFWKPVYVPVDHRIIKNILIKDFNSFVDRFVYVNEADDPLSAHLFTIHGNKWRSLRAKLTPTFSPGKLKMMFPFFLSCAANLKAAMNNICDSEEAFEAKDFMSRFTTDVIGLCAFGLECDSFKNPNSDFRKYGQKVLDLTVFQSFVTFFGICSGDFARSLKLKFTLPEVTDFFMTITKETIEHRLKNNIRRDDFMHLLMNLQNDDNDGNNVDNSNKDARGLTFKEIAAQLLLFFVAGHETSSTAMMFCLYELAVNQDMQDKVRQEIKLVLNEHRGELTYDSLSSFRYMEQVIDESLRKYPPVPMLNRKCVEEYAIPGTGVTLEKGTLVLLSVTGLHRDPEFYPDPEKFDPERFNDENKHKIAPCTYLPFGDGPRNCLGLRFGKMETKIALATLLKDFKFTLSSKTRVPLVIDPKNLIYTVKDGMWLNVHKL